MNEEVELFLRNWDKIAAITPYYQRDGRNGSVVWYINGKHKTFPNRRCSWLVDMLAEYLFTSVETATQQAAAFLGKGGLRKPPLFLHPELCLLQLKCRVERQRNSSTIGYVAVQKIHTVMQSETGGCRIVLYRNGNILETTQKIRSVGEQIQMGHRLIELHMLKQRAQMEEASALPLPAAEPPAPTTPNATPGKPTRGLDGS